MSHRNEFEIASQPAETNAIDALARAASNSAEQTAATLAEVGQLAEQISGESGEAVAAALRQAVKEMSIDVDTKTACEQLRAALADIVRSQVELPRRAAELVRQAHQRTLQIAQRSVDVRVGKAMLPVIERITADITQEDVQAAREANEKMKAMESLFGDEPIFEALPAPEEEISDVSRAAKLLAAQRQKRIS